MTRLRIVSRLLTTCILLCAANRSYADTSYVKSSVEKTSKDFIIPRELRDRIEKNYLEFVRNLNPKIVLPDEDVLARIPRDYLNIEVLLRAAAPGTLENNAQIVLPRGGGEIDLKSHVTGQRGSFFLKFNVVRSSEPDAEISNLHVYFLSETKKKKVAKNTFGSGCKTYMGVSDLIKNANAGEGLQLNATDLRYLPVIGGTFYFFNFDSERKMYISAVRFIDSRYPELACDMSESL